MNLFNLDFAKSWQLLFQDPATPIMEGIIDLHHNIFFFLLLILFLVLYILFFFLDKFYYSCTNKKITIATVLPSTTNGDEIMSIILEYFNIYLPILLLSLGSLTCYKLYKSTGRKIYFALLGYFSIITLVIAKLAIDLSLFGNQILIILSFFSYMFAYNYIIKNMKVSFHSYAQKIDKKIYKDLVQKYQIINFVLYLRLLVFGILGYQFERKPGFIEVLRVLSLVMFFFYVVGPVLGTFLIFIFLLNLSAQREQYNRHLYFRANYENNRKQFQLLESKTELFNNKKVNSLSIWAIRKMSKLAEAHHIVMMYPGRAAVASLFFGSLAAGEVWGQKELRQQDTELSKKDFETHNRLRPDKTYHFQKFPEHKTGTGAAHTASVLYEKSKSTLQATADFYKNKKNKPPNNDGFGGGVFGDF